MARMAERVLTPQGDELFPKFVASLDPDGTSTIRKQRLQVVWLVMGMCNELLHRRWTGKRGVRVAPSSIVQARDRLGDEPIRSYPRVVKINASVLVEAQR